jgi:hypothetical protein
MSFGTDDFTIETWARLTTSTGNYQFIIDARNSTAVSPWFLTVDPNNKIYFFYGATLISNASITYGQWQHYAVTRSAGVIRVFIDGIADTVTTTYTSAINAGVQSRIGRATDQAGFYLNGYIDDLRITRGVARYVSNFTPPTAPFPDAGPPEPDFANVSLLLHGDGANGSTTIIDSSPSPKTVSVVGDAQISTAQSKFGGASLAFDGNGDYLSITDSNAFEFGSGDYTIELWFYMLALPPANDPYALFGGLSGKNFYFGVGTYYGVGTILISYDGFTELNQTSGASITAGAWYHTAHCRSNGTARLFLNGQVVRSGTFGSITGTTGYQVGASSFYNRSRWNGYIDDLRITKGVAHYTANFTPPTAPFPDV